MKNTFLLGALALVMAGCDNQLTVSITPGNNISFDAYVGKASKAGDLSNTTLENFYVFGGYDASSLVFNGDEVTQVDGLWIPTVTRQWEEGKNYRFAAVSPIIEGAAFNLDKLTLDNYSPGEDDLIVAVSEEVKAKESDNHVSLNFRHALSRVQMSIDNEDPDLRIEVSDVTLSNVTNKGNLTATFDTGTSLTWENAQQKGSYTFKMANGSSVSYLLPQKISNDITVTFHAKASANGIVLMEDSFSFPVKTENIDEWEAGHAYNYTINYNVGKIEFAVKEVESWEGEGADPEIPSNMIRILAIGNSFSQDAVEQYLYELFHAAGYEAVIGNLYIGGCRLDTHWANAQSGDGAYEYRKVVEGVKTQTNNVALSTGLTDEEWDIITLQQASGSSGQYETYSPYLGNLIDWIAERSDADIWFHQTWAYAKSSTHDEFPKYDSDQMTMYNAIMNSVQQAMTDNNQLKGVIPSGTAIQNARTTFLGDTFNRDGYHLETTYGRYTAACTWFESLTGIEVVGNEYAPATVNSQHKAIAQNAAHYAVINPFEVTIMTDYEKPNVQGSLTWPVFIDFGGNNAGSYWNCVSEPDASEVYLIDSQGDYTSATLTITVPFATSFNGAGSEPSNDIVAGGISWPKGVWADSFVAVGTPGQGASEASVIEIDGLDPTVTYTAIVLSARWNGSSSARQARFEIVTANGTEYAEIRPGIGRDAGFAWETFDFSTLSHTFENVSPKADGTIELRVVGNDVGSTVVEGNISAFCITPY